MTSRLKHKLELEQINLNSAYLNESFVQIGTPLPALSRTKKDQLEYVPEWKQEVRDEQGRRRFHGAFTGGFSAGYFNTAGSKEGWAPSTFKSSRTNRANKTQRPEDFMDEEDLQQMNDDRKLENTETFQNEGFAGTREALGDQGVTSALESLIAPARSSIGQTLLKKLGWRPGQGIGPRVSLRKLRLQEKKLGLRSATTEAEDIEADAEAGKHTFAPRDTKLVVYEGKAGREGLGYEKGKGMGRLPGIAGPSFEARRDAMDEDEDPYGPATSIEKPYAFDGADDEDDVIVMGGPSRPNVRREQGRARQPVDDVERWHDGRPILPGFTLDPLGVPTDKWFEMPEIPPDWRPRPARVWGTTRRWDEAPNRKPAAKEVIRGAPGKPLTFEERGAALGEEQRQSTAKSVFEYISEKDRERIASIAKIETTSAPPPLSLTTEPEVEEAKPSADEVIIPPLSPRTASAALKGYMPYTDDLPKQDRYRSYLSSQTYNTKTPNPTLRTGTFDQINKELEDFSASARIFKPMSFAMSSRFTTGSSALAASDLKQAKPGLHIYDAEKMKAETGISGKGGVVEVEVEVRKNMTPREEAARDGIYGKLTRVVGGFYPGKLLCKRFGVADPHPEGEPKGIEVGKAGGGGGGGGFEGMALPKNDASWEDKFVHKPGTDGVVGEEGVGNAIGGGEEIERRPRNLGEVGMAEDGNQGRDTLSYTKPSIDIFKAIFASDDEDEDEDDEGEVVTPAVTLPIKVDAVAVAVRQVNPFPVKVKIKEEGPVDLTTFKPVFALRKDEEDISRSKEERKKDKKDKKKRKGVLSFDVGEDGEDEGEDKRREEKKRKKKEKDGNSLGGKDRPVVVEEDEGEWVEKPSVNPRTVGRKGAADFM